MTAKLTAEVLRQVLDYDPNTGLFRWRVATSNRIKVGQVAECRDVHGYVQIGVLGTRHKAHRLVWLYVHGRWPREEVDHINRNRADNRLANLRECSRAENNQNCTKRIDNTSGHTGVTWNARKRKWQAQIGANGKNVVIGCFDSVEAASAAYVKAKQVHHTYGPRVP